MKQLTNEEIDAQILKLQALKATKSRTKDGHPIEVGEVYYALYYGDIEPFTLELKHLRPTGIYYRAEHTNFNQLYKCPLKIKEELIRQRKRAVESAEGWLTAAKSSLRKAEEWPI